MIHRALAHRVYHDDQGLDLATDGLGMPVRCGERTEWLDTKTVEDAAQRLRSGTQVSGV